MSILSRWNSEWIIRKADRLVRKGKGDRALQLIESSLAKSPSNLDLLIQKAWLEMDQNRWEAAQVSIQALLALSTDNPVVYMLKGELELKLKKNKEAKLSLLKSLELSGDNIRVEYLLGLVSIAENDFDKAAQFFDSTLRYDKNFVKSRLLVFAEHYLMNQKRF